MAATFQEQLALFFFVTAILVKVACTQRVNICAHFNKDCNHFLATAYILMT